jgi:hypothetical protein
VDEGITIYLVGSAHDPESGHRTNTFSLVYGSEATLPMEIEHKSLRVQNFLKNGPMTPESMI